MSIINKKGCVVTALLNKEVDYIIHVTNCMHTMGSGLALQIKNEIISAFNAYLEAPNKLGTVSYGGGVFNMNAQHNFGERGARYLNYGALAICLTTVANTVEKKSKIGIATNTGAVRAGGDWEIVKEMVDFILGKNFTLVYYDFDKG